MCVISDSERNGKQFPNWDFIGTSRSCNIAWHENIENNLIPHREDMTFYNDINISAVYDQTINTYVLQ